MSDTVDILNLLNVPRRLDTAIGWRDGLAITRAGFIESVDLWRSALQDHPGSRFALYFADSVEFSAALFGAWHAAKTVYLASDTLPATCAALGSVVDGYVGEFPANCMSLAIDADGRGSSDTFFPLRADFPGLVVYTSGSTGTPQAIPKKLSQLATEVATIEQLFGKDAGNGEVVATVSHQHIYGLLFKVLWPLATGRAIHARSLSYPEELAQVTTTRDCVLVSSPAHLKRLPDSAAWRGAAHRVHAVFSSGGPLPLEVAQTTSHLLGQAPLEIYGSSETGGIAWRQRHSAADDAWTMMIGVESRMSRDAQVLEIRSPHLPDATWFRTSDRAQTCSNGRLTLLGRIDRLVKVEEKRISLDLIEAKLVQSALVQEARVLVLDGHRQRVVAFVVLSGAGRASLSESGKHALNSCLREDLAQAVERVALPRSWYYLDALPINAQGKTTQAELMALLKHKGLAAGTAKSDMPNMRVIDKNAERVLIALTAPRGLAYFDGHFPQTPILPGVTQLEWAVMLARDNFILPPLMRAVHALKFQAVIRPDTSFSLELVHDVAKDCVTFKFFSAASVHASGRLMFGVSNV